MVEIRSGEETVAAALVIAVVAGVVMAGMSDGNALVDGLTGGGAALVGFACWTVGYVFLFRDND